MHFISQDTLKAAVDVVYFIVIYAELQERIRAIYKVIFELNTYYCEIMEKAKVCRKKKIPLNWNLMKEFKQAYEEDMVRNSQWQLYALCKEMGA